ncbi:MAG: hypothetical protein V1668_03165 [Patescibacteria group bacterium]
MGEFIQTAIDWVTDPGGLGFPILIGVGLGAIVYMMNKQTKSWRKADTKVEKKKDALRNYETPFKPF